MAKYRVVHTHFWEDQKVEEMVLEDRHLFLYLLTNKHTKQIGIYTISKRQMAFDTYFCIDTVNSSLERLIEQYKLVKYNPDTREIAIKNWGKYNFIRGGKPVEDCVRSEMEEVKDRELIRYVGERITNRRFRDMYESYLDVPFESSNNAKASNQAGVGDTLTIRGQNENEKEKEKEKQKQKQKQLLRGSRGQENVIDFYQQNFGMLSPFITEEILDSVDEFGEELVLEAMKISLTVGKRNWRYTYGILKRWRDERVKTLGDVWALDKEFEQQKKVSSAIPNNLEIYEHNPSEGEDPR
ncbi:DnaD domain-containing protein [Lederbergia panacisoli]|uniref:DnaD domain-containing protein n=1 Tax=Lederbergia panacisoli TaxID=1255251 RepID=UPI00214BE707|nr:DnaD domain protein [Lederbergia panacisoli]MCR2823305.1 DnaD domain protein [Lederbergia panacisoli]